MDIKPLLSHSTTGEFNRRPYRIYVGLTRGVRRLLALSGGGRGPLVRGAERVRGGAGGAGGPPPHPGHDPAPRHHPRGDRAVLGCGAAGAERGVLPGAARRAQVAPPVFGGDVRLPHARRGGGARAHDSINININISISIIIVL
eukprot:574413-Prorocentrum_minimum.AAC.2